MRSNWSVTISCHIVLYLQDFLKFQYLIPLIGCYQICHCQNFRVIFISAVHNLWEGISEGGEGRNKTTLNQDAKDLRLGFLPVKWIDLRLHQHVGKNEVSDMCSKNEYKILKQRKSTKMVHFKVQHIARGKKKKKKKEVHWHIYAYTQHV